ncbi:MAG: zinc ribbon domain-containing protein [Asgard group archaeon]|nr:zinc ribbon domain-containing protein [Asgard group archaeon]
MEGDIVRKRRIEGLITSWSMFAFWMFFFAVIGIVVAGWFTIWSWWIWLVGGMMFIGAVAETIRFVAQKHGRRRRLSSLIGSWSFFLFFVLLFYIVGILTAQWFDYNDWWVWFIIGIFFFGAVISTIRFFIYNVTAPKETPFETPVVVVDTTVQKETVVETAKPPVFCESCGVKIEGSEQFCSNCGAPIK